MNKYNINQTYFDTWSTKMSYILGFTTADGYIVRDKSHRLLGFGLHPKDIEILEFIREEITNAPIKMRQIKRLDKCHPQAQLIINSIYIIDTLAQFNIIPRKTGKEILPNIPDEYKADYLRGLFDGDGCIYKRLKYKSYTMSISGASYSFLSDVKDRLCFQFGNIKKNGNNWEYNIHDINKLRLIYNYMYYKNYPFCLKRKQEKFSGVLL